MRTVTQSCPMGLTSLDIKELFGGHCREFWQWMSGQTMGLCDGRSYRHERYHSGACGHKEGDEYTWQCGYTGTGKYVSSVCRGRPHGIVAYRSDVERFMAGLPVIDEEET